MARLSAEHLKNNTSVTPEQTRISSRFRDLFKGSHSRSSLSDGPNATDSLEISPLGAENAKHGFHKAGLLPSERTDKLKKQRKAKKRESPRESLERQAEELKDVSVPHAIDTGLEASDVRLGDGVKDAVKNSEVEHKKQDREDVTQNIEEASAQDLITHLREDRVLEVEGGETAAAKIESDAGNAETKSSSPGEEQTVPLVSIADLEPLNPAQVVVEKVPDIDSGEHTTGPPQPNWVITDKPHQALSVVEENITEQSDDATDQPEPQHATIEPTAERSSDSEVSPVVGVVSPTSMDSTTERVSHQMNIVRASILSIPSRVDAPYISPAYALALYRIFTVLYTASLLRLALIGPKTFLVTVWKIGIVLMVYTLGRRQLGLAGQNVVLEPVEDGLKLMGGLMAERLDAILEELAAKIARRMKEGAVEEEGTHE